MNESTRHLAEGVRRFSAVLHAFEAGLTVDQLREVILETLRPEFQNQDALERYGIDLLTVEATNISNLRLKPKANDLYHACMSLRTSLLSKDHDRCAEVCSLWEQEIGAGLHLYWNSARLEVNKGDLSLDEFAYEAFRNIGSLLEATTQPYLRELLHIHRQGAANGVASKDDISALDFGTVVAQLEAGPLSADLLRPQPWNLPLNQWRNIAQHYSIASDGATISCRYGKRNRAEIRLTRTELTEALASIFSLHLAIRTAHTIFFLDNGRILSKHCRGFTRKDSDVQFQFIVGAASQGFEVTLLDVTPAFSKAVLRDCTTLEPTARGIHASQFVLGLWQATKSERVRIDYVTKEGCLHLYACALGDQCALVDSGEQDVSYLAEVVGLSQIER